MKKLTFTAGIAKRLVVGLLILLVVMPLPLSARAAEGEIHQENGVVCNNIRLLANDAEPPVETEPPATEPPAPTLPPIEDMTPEQIAELVENMSTDDINLLLSKLSFEDKKKLLRSLPKEQYDELISSLTQEELDQLFGEILQETGDEVTNGFVELLDDYINSFTENVIILIRGSLFLEELDIDTGTFSSTNINNALNLMYGVMVLLLFLKFAWKGIKVYTLWRDGDADVPPTQMYTNAIVAVVTAMMFPSIYKLIGRFILSFGNRLIEEFPAFSLENGPGAFDAIGAIGLINVFYFIIEIILSIVILSQGIELFVLRMGVPIAVSGMVDTDGGVWKPYTAALVKTFASILVRIVLLGLSFRVIVANSLISTALAIALCLTAFKMPRILGQIIMPGTQSAGGAARTVMMAMRMFRRR